MTDRPILFSAPMVRALLEGRKTQTRRILKPQPEYPFGIEGDEKELHATLCSDGVWRIFSPLCQEAVSAPLRVRFAKGDRLWVREMWAPLDRLTHNDPGTTALAERGFYRADESTADDSISKWTPSIHMPRSASRLTLTVTDVRIQRLQSITEIDAVAEGATMRPRCSGFLNMDDGWSMDWSRVGQPSKWAANGETLSDSDICLVCASHAFGSLFEKLNGARTWDSNPWVIALTFIVERRNIDA